MIDRIVLIFENCETMEFKPEELRNIEIEGPVEVHGSSGNLSFGHPKLSMYNEYRYAKAIHIDILEEALSKPHYVFSNTKDKSMTKLERLQKWQDITWVHIYTKERKFVKWFKIPFVHKSIVVKLGWDKHVYEYGVHWCPEDLEHDMLESNRWQMLERKDYKNIHGYTEYDYSYYDLTISEEEWRKKFSAQQKSSKSGSAKKTTSTQEESPSKKTTQRKRSKTT